MATRSECIWRDFPASILCLIFYAIDPIEMLLVVPIEMLLAGPIAEVKVIIRFPSSPQKQTMSVSSATEV